jgi:putative transposase
MVSNRMKRDLAIRALDMAVVLRQPPKDCIYYPDRGSQYCSNAYQRRLSKHGFKVLPLMVCNQTTAAQRMSGKGNCYDNSPLGRFTL